MKKKTIKDKISEVLAQAKRRLAAHEFSTVQMAVLDEAGHYEGQQDGRAHCNCTESTLSRRMREMAHDGILSSGIREGKNFAEYWPNQNPPRMIPAHPQDGFATAEETPFSQPKHYELRELPELSPNEKTLAMNAHGILAIKLYRQRNGSSLWDSKRKVDEYRASLPKEQQAAQ